jgi:hypothetical protein
LVLVLVFCSLSFGLYVVVLWFFGFWSFGLLVFWSFVLVLGLFSYGLGLALVLVRSWPCPFEVLVKIAPISWIVSLRFATKKKQKEQAVKTWKIADAMALKISARVDSTACFVRSGLILFYRILSHRILSYLRLSFNRIPTMDDLFGFNNANLHQGGSQRDILPRDRVPTIVRSNTYKR